MKPPRGTIDTVGASKISTSWIRSSNGKFRVRAKRRTEPSDVAK
jgi:hypothetical protein